MKKVLLFGAGKSATTLIHVLSDYCQKHGHELIVCDQDLQLAESKITGYRNTKAVNFDVNDEQQRQTAIAAVDLVISLLPAFLHIKVAKDCLKFRKNLLTASYIDEQMKALADDVQDRGVLFLSEMGLDPGIDHMSAMKIIDELKEQGAEIRSFYSHCGGLVAPESDDNPWHYKITWNPRNVVSAGRAGAQYLERGVQKQLGYGEVFAQEGQIVHLQGVGDLGWYANRDSLSYIDTYGLRKLDTFIRTTLRYPSYIEAWNLLVQMGLTSETDGHELAGCRTYHEWFQKNLSAFNQGRKDAVNQLLNKPQLQEQFRFLGLYDERALRTHASSAEILLGLLEEKWIMRADDKDMIVMIHEVDYKLDGTEKKLTSSLLVKGSDSVNTAMSKTVGTPLAIAAGLLLEGKMSVTGLHIPVIPEIYLPVLEELRRYEIAFDEKIIG